MREWGYRGPIHIVVMAAKKDGVDSTIVDLLRANNAKMIILNSKEKHASDDHIRHLISTWTSKHRLLANILLISGDGDFAYTLHNLTRSC